MIQTHVITFISAQHVSCIRLRLYRRHGMEPNETTFKQRYRKM